MIRNISKSIPTPLSNLYPLPALSGTRFYASKRSNQQLPPKPEATSLQGAREVPRTPAPLFLRLAAVGSTFFAFYYIWRPFDDPKNNPNALPDFGPRTFTRCVVHSVTPDPPEAGKQANHIVVHMGIPAQNLPKDGSYLTNAIHHIYIKDDDMQVERPYTPINGVGVDGKMMFWIKKYPGGEVSNWISRLYRNRNIEVRGPVPQWDWRSGSWDEIVMIGGGTGITAFTQLLHQALFSSQPVTSVVGSKTHFTLLHGHQSPSQLPPTVITEDFDLYRESTPGRFTERVFVDSLDSEADDIPRGVNLGRIDKMALENVLVERGILNPHDKRLNPAKSVMVLVCGPEGLITSLTGPRPTRGSGSTIGGVLGGLGFDTTQVRRF